jgi:hypothetical protein
MTHTPKEPQAAFPDEDLGMASWGVGVSDSETLM